MKKAIKVSLLVSSLMFAACGGDDNNGSNNGNNGTDNNGMTVSSAFDCASQTCDSNTQYCLLSTQNDTYATQECVDLPSNCSSCDCAQDDAPNHFPTSNNCDGIISCSSSNGAVEVTCFVPASIF